MKCNKAKNVNVIPVRAVGESLMSDEIGIFNAARHLTKTRKIVLYFQF